MNAIHKNRSIKVSLPEGTMVSVNGGQNEAASCIIWRWQSAGLALVRCERSGVVPLRQVRLVGVMEILQSLSNVKSADAGAVEGRVK